MIDGDRVVQQVHYPHPIEAVWQLMTDSAAIAAWLMPNDFVAVVGHRFRLDARPVFGFIDGEVLEVDPPRYLHCRWMIEGTPTSLTIRLQADETGTLVSLEHIGLPDELRRGFDRDWGAKLRHDGQLVLRGERDIENTRSEDDLNHHPGGRTVRTIHHVVDIDAAPGPIWSALTEAGPVEAWWSTKVTTPEPAIGAQIVWTFAEDFNPVMDITTLDKPRLLEWRCVGGHEPWQDSTFRFELVPLDAARTRLRFTQGYGVELSDDAYGIYNFNWGYYLESLRLLCATGEGKPFRP